MSLKEPRIVIAGTNSGSGKTTITMALMAALIAKGYAVQGFKVGPDYIDPSFHTAITGRPSRNLDTWMMPEEVMKEIFIRGSDGADVSVIEGVMGLFDGRSGASEEASTAELAKKLKAPVILVVNAASQARSVAALIHGFRTFDPDVHVAGVIFNQVGSHRHYEYLEEAVHALGSVALLGYLPRDEGVRLPERHLGLVPAEENDTLQAQTDKLRDQFIQHVDLQRLMSIAKTDWYSTGVGEGLYSLDTQVKGGFHSLPVCPSGDNNESSPCVPPVPVAIAWDKAFSFYYQDNLDWLADRGVEWVPVSPLEDRELPQQVRGVYLGGGFPELYADKLSGNQPFIEAIRALHDEQDIPILAECGGLMYLCEGLRSLQGDTYPMAGLIPGHVEMCGRLQALGYREGQALQDSILLKQGDRIRGHEFHYSTYHPQEPKGENTLEAAEHRQSDAFHLVGRRCSRKTGYVKGNLLASYLHIHLGSNPGAGYRLLDHFRGASIKR